MIHKSLLDTIGSTPIIKLNKVLPQNSPHQFWAKLEFFNPGLSIKDRIAQAIISGAEKRGDLPPGGTIVEATSGNTGVGLAMVAAIKGYKCVFVMPEKISMEKQDTLKAYGAEVIITPSGLEPDDPQSHYSVAKKVAAENPNAYLTNQYDNLDNRKLHFDVTGPEIWEQTEGQLDVFVAGIGTGGTLSGVGQYLKSKNSQIKIVCNDPIGSILADLHKYGEVKEPPASYLVEGIGEDMLPECVDFTVIDDFIKVNDKQAFQLCRRLAKEEGLMVGPSSASALFGAFEYAKTLSKPSNILVLMADHGSKYLSKAFNDKWIQEKGF